MKIRVIIEIDKDDVMKIPATYEYPSDAIAAVLIEAFDTPNVSVLDVVEEGESAWFRSERF